MQYPYVTNQHSTQDAGTRLEDEGEDEYVDVFILHNRPAIWDICAISRVVPVTEDAVCRELSVHGSKMNMAWLSLSLSHGSSRAGQPT